MTLTVEAESRFLDSANGRVHFQIFGEGPALILLHGGGPGAYGLSNFSKNVASLARTNSVIVPDLPGFGRSDTRDFKDGLFQPMADATLEIMDHLGLASASLVGNSLGGGTALRVALDHPTRIDKLVLMGPGGSLPATSTFPSEGLLRMLNFYEGEGPTLEKLRRVIDLLVFDPSTITEALIEARFEAATTPALMANPPLRGQGHNPRNDLWRDDIDRLPQKVLLIWGRDDRVIPLDMAFILLKRIPNADLHVFSKCGHWVQWEKADEFNEMVREFVNR